MPDPIESPGEPQHDRHEAADRLNLEELERLLHQIEGAEPDKEGNIVLVHDRVLQVLRAAIAAETELARLRYPVP